MFGFAIRRLLSTIPILFIALTICFFVLRLAPGGPFDNERQLPEKVLANLQAHYHLDKPLIEQYFLYISAVLQGDLGPSFATEDFTVAELIGLGLPYTLILGGAAFIVSIVFGMGAGVISGLYQNKSADYVTSATVMTGLIIPNFLMAPILQLVFGIQLEWLPVGGWGDGSIAYLTLPVIVLSLTHIARISRLMRGSLIETMNSNYIRTARSKGIG